MDEIFKQLKSAQKIGMTETEKARVRNNLLRMSKGASLSNVPRAASNPSPYASAISPFSFLSRAVAFFLVGFIVGGTSISFASANTLPGDKLYSIKTNITEKIVGAFSFSTESKARYEASLVGKRLTEIQTLNNNGKLSDAAISAQATASFATTFNSYEGKLAELGNQGRAARVQEIAQSTLGELAPTLALITPKPQEVAIVSDTSATTTTSLTTATPETTASPSGQMMAMMKTATPTVGKAQPTTMKVSVAAAVTPPSILETTLSLALDQLTPIAQPGTTSVILPQEEVSPTPTAVTPVSEMPQTKKYVTAPIQIQTAVQASVVTPEPTAASLAPNNTVTDQPKDTDSEQSAAELMYQQRLQASRGAAN